jgi:hypothetical protein
VKPYVSLMVEVVSGKQTDTSYALIVNVVCARGFSLLYKAFVTVAWWPEL